MGIAVIDPDGSVRSPAVAAVRHRPTSAAACRNEDRATALNLGDAAPSGGVRSGSELLASCPAAIPSGRLIVRPGTGDVKRDSLTRHDGNRRLYPAALAAGAVSGAVSAGCPLAVNLQKIAAKRNNEGLRSPGV
jgi:hypothetical protein